MEKDKDIFDHLKPGKVQVPDPSYFEQLAKKVIMDEKKVIPLYRKPISWITAAAATIAVVLTTVLYTGERSGEQNVLLALNNFTAEEISDYIEANIDDFEIEEIAAFIPDSSLNYSAEYLFVSDETPSGSTLSFDDINDTDILEYLDDQELDPYELEDESFI